MKKHIYSLIAVLVVAIFITNCEGESFIKPIQEGINSKDYAAALSAADTAITKDPTNGTPYYYKALAYEKMAEANPNVSGRKPTYVKMHESILKAEELYAASEKPGAESKLITNLVLSAWSTEHNAAIGFATNDSIMATVDAPLEISIAHLENAVTINPDSILSFDVLAQIYFMNKDYENAAGALTKVISLQDQASSSEYDRLGSYYFMSNQPDKAVNILQEGLEFYPDSTKLIQKLADGLFQINKTDEALDFMGKLIESDPSNARYRLVVGSRVYQRALTLSDQVDKNTEKIAELKSNNGSEEEIATLTSDNESLQTEVDDLTDTAEEALLKAAELDETIDATFNTLGILYQNKSAGLFVKRNNTLDNEEANMYDDMAKEELRTAMTFYEKAAEINPDNPNYWSSLANIYTTLGMMDKASEAFDKAGM